MAYPRSHVEVSNKGAVVGGRYSEPMATAMRTWLQGVLRRVRDDARAFAPSDLGAFRASIIYRTQRREMVLEGEVFSTDANQAKVAVIEFGRTPGKKMPPKGALLGWMARHGIPEDREFVVRRAIGRDGIPGKFPFRKAWNRNRGLLASQSRNLSSSLVTALNRA
jgi:hypothetical protein